MNETLVRHGFKLGSSNKTGPIHYWTTPGLILWCHVWHGFEWFCYVLIPLAPGTAEPIWTLPTTKLYKTNRWETWEVQRILATHHGFHHFPSCFQTGLVQTSSILVLDHPWFNSLVPCLTWFWNVLNGFCYVLIPLASGTAEPSLQQSHTKPADSVWQGTRWDTIALIANRLPCNWSVT